MSVQSLREDANGYRKSAQSKRDEAIQHTQAAARSGATGDVSRAMSENDAAGKLNADAADLEKKAMQIEQVAQKEELKANELEKQKQTLLQQANQLDNEEKRILGN